jgi:hypothetical protein
MTEDDADMLKGATSVAALNDPDPKCRCNLVGSLRARMVQGHILPAGAQSGDADNDRAYSTRTSSTPYAAAGERHADALLDGRVFAGRRLRLREIEDAR